MRWACEAMAIMFRIHEHIHTCFSDVHKELSNSKEGINSSTYRIVFG